MSDYIDRQAVIDAIEKLVLPQTKGETMAEEINRVAWRCAINCAEEMIRHLPPVEVEPVKRGKWEITEAYPHNVHCSVCHKRYAQTHWAVWEDGSLPRAYCPNCGAKMEPFSASSENGREVEA